MEHMGFGLVLKEDGSKFKSSEGDSIRLMELLNEGKSRALKQLKKRTSEELKEEPGTGTLLQE